MNEGREKVLGTKTDGVTFDKQWIKTPDVCFQRLFFNAREKHLHGTDTDFIGWLANGCHSWLYKRGKVNVVIACQRDVLGDPEFSLSDGFECTQRNQIVAAGDSRERNATAEKMHGLAIAGI